MINILKIDLPTFKIGNLEINIMQGSMGVGISGSGLVGAVSKCGGGGTLASPELGLSNGGREAKRIANREALRVEIKKARAISSKGVIGVNVLYASEDYSGLVGIADEEKVDYIVCGAGPALDLPLLVKNQEIKLIPIVSSLQAAKIFCYHWKKKGHSPDAIGIEGPK